MSKKHEDKFLKLVEREVEQHPYSFDGYQWAAKSQSWYAQQLEVSNKTVGCLMQLVQIDRLDIKVGGLKTPLLRIKKPGDLMTVTHCQRILQKVFLSTLGPLNEKKAKFHEAAIAALTHNLAPLQEEYEAYVGQAQTNKQKIKAKKAEIECLSKQQLRETKKLEKAKVDAKKKWSLSPQNYGRLRGLVEAWSVEDAVEIFTLALENWPEFMAATKVFISEYEGALPVYYRYYEYPTLSYLLIYNHVALEMYLMKLQAEISSTPVSSVSAVMGRVQQIMAAYELGRAECIARLAAKGEK